MRRNNAGPLLPVIILFIVLSSVFITGRNFLERLGVDQSVLIAGSVYVSIMAKLFICIIAALIYIFIFRKELNKPALFTCMGLYLVYTLVEVSILTKLLKEKKNA